MHSQNLNIARRYLGEVWSLGRVESVLEIVAPECTFHDPLVGDYVGIAALTAHVREVRRAFPHLAWKIDDVLADADSQLALTWSARGTRGAQRTEVSGLMLLRFDRGMLIAVAAHWKPSDLFRQARESELDAHWDLDLA